MTDAVLDLDRDTAQAAARSRAYRLFAEALEYPDAELHARIAQGRLARELREALAQVDASLLSGLNDSTLTECGTRDELQVEYTRLFDTAAAKNACSLYESGYVGSRDQALEECLRFYDHFGLALSEESREMPDYLVTQLEFLHYVAYCQATTAQDGDPTPYRLAENDFIERHPGRWVPKFHEKLHQMQPIGYFDQTVAALRSFLGCCARQLRMREQAAQ